MEFLRKRVESDPYEAVFGKRFEPFWSPLVPAWMREEMGLRGGATWGKVDFAKILEQRKDRPRGPNHDGERVEIKKKMESAQKGSATPTTTPKPAMTNKTVPTPDPTATSAPYALYTATSWDSWTQRTKRTEWDSDSARLRLFEYDPVSNRMVPLPSPSAAEKKVEPKSIETPKTVVVKNVSALEVRRTEDMRSLINSPKQGSATAVLVQESALASVATVTPAATIVAATNSSTGPEKATRLAQTSEGINGPIPESLTASWVPKAARRDGAAPLSHGPSRERRVVGFAPPPPSPLPPTPSVSPSTTSFEHASVVDEDSLTADVLRARMGNLRTQVRQRSEGPAGKATPTSGVDSKAETLEQSSASSSDRTADSIDPLKMMITAIERRLAAVSPRSSADAGSKSPLQPAVDRMPWSAAQPAPEDLDDAAAHESTESTEPPSAAVPKEWSSAADLLQTSRIQRTVGKRPFPKPLPRWIDDMRARKAAHEASKALSVAEQAEVKARSERLEKVNKLLEAEVQEQKANMQAFEGRYKSKMKGMRDEVELAYKQSAVQGGMHVERIRFLEGELEKNAGGKALESALAEDGKVTATARADAAQNKGDAAVIVQGEGDFAPDIAKWADRERWYKQPTAQRSQASQQDMEKSEQKTRDRELVRSVREVYESEYGIIEAGHRQRETTTTSEKQVVEVESDVDLGEALAEHEKRVSYAFKEDGLESEMLMKEREAHEAQALTEVAADSRGLECQIREADEKGRLVQQLLTEQEAKDAAEVAKAEKTQPAETGSLVQWQQPPVYKILAYDSGNDIFTTATTTANFSGTETPMGIPQALSQLYQPARFVPHFAKLQEDGWQVIHGTSDLLVFKKVAVLVPAEPMPAASALEQHQSDETVGLVDHGVITPKENALAQEAANFYDKYPPSPQEYDPTSIDNGKLTPYENAMAQEAAHAYDAAASSRASTAVNPIDGTTRVAPPTEVPTGHFASPTGFVNHDRTFLDEVSSAKVREAMNKEPGDEAIGTLPSPRIRRQEQVFSGTQRAAGGKSRKQLKKQRWREARERREGARKPRAGAVWWALRVGVCAAGVAYAVGVAAEMAKQEKVERERWRDVVEGRRGRWE
ncbi:hypothetical protein LTR53_005848 [Teratosphaeriaceae sp. CCFEE 6253]|nr:hypothetical protein LTR53_005848 [Teratosphaeriaceae sp. CCFEE 6253]